MSIWKRILGSESPVPDPDFGRLYWIDDDDIVHVFEITCADFNIYELDDYYWLTLFVKADVKLEPDKNNPKPFLEINLFFEENPETSLRPGKILDVSSYHEKLYNLSQMYYWSHRSFDGKIFIESFKDASITALVKGESDDDPVVLRAEFCHNPERRRSFS